jgi:hypothetical protein
MTRILHGPASLLAAGPLNVWKAHNLLNWLRKTHARGGHCSYLSIPVFCVNSLGSVFKQVSWSIVPNESAEAFTYAYNGIRAASRRGPCDSEPGSACDFCEQLHDIQESQEVAKVLNIASNPHEKLPLKRAGADNTTKWLSFATRILKQAKVLVCAAHATGDSLICTFVFWFLCLNEKFCTGIAWQKQAFLDFFENYDNYNSLQAVQQDDAMESSSKLGCSTSAACIGYRHKRACKYVGWLHGLGGTQHILWTQSSSPSPRCMFFSNFFSFLPTTASGHDSAFGQNCLGSCISGWC